MALSNVSSPHVHQHTSSADVMRQVIYATMPGIALLTYFFGFGTLINICLLYTSPSPRDS